MKRLPMLISAHAIAIAIAIACALAGTLACTLMLPPRFSVTDWTPGDGSPVLPGDAVISITFNRPPKRICTEQAFSLTAADSCSAGEASPAGRFSWEERTMTFTPFNQLPENRRYEIRLNTGASDCSGNSLAEDFTSQFSTGPVGPRPSIVSIVPADNTSVEDLFVCIRVEFDRPVDFGSVLESFSCSPEITGISAVDQSRTIFTFKPVKQLTPRQEYTVTISEQLRSIDGCRLASEFSSSFTAGIDDTAPEVLSATAGTVELLGSPADNPQLYINTGIEKDTAVTVAFSEGLKDSCISSAVSIEPSARFSTAAHPDSPEKLIISFDEMLSWQKLYCICLTENIRDMSGNSLPEPLFYYLYVDGASSKPPAIAGVNIVPDEAGPVTVFSLTDPGSAADSHPVLDTSAGDASKEPFYIDYYFDLACLAELPFFSFTDNYLIDPQNSCVSINYLDFQLFNPGDDLSSAAAPVPVPGENQAVVRLITELTDICTESGFITFRVFSGLTDSLGNSMAEDWGMRLFDED